MRKRILSLFLVAVMLVSMIAAYPMTVNAAGNTWNPDGGVYEISTTEDIVAFAAAVDGGQTFAGKTITLKEDILLPTSWDEIGSVSGYAFCGTFDGQGHTITMNGHVSNKSEEGALFGYLGDGATITDFKLDGAFSMTANQWQAAVVNWAVGDVEISNIVCSVQMVDNSTNSDFINSAMILAGIHRIADSSIDIRNVVCNGTMEISATNIVDCGVFVANTHKRDNGIEKTLNISNCVFAGNVNLDATKVEDFGIFVGYISEAMSNSGSAATTVNINDCLSVKPYEVSNNCSSYNDSAVLVGWKKSSVTLNISDVYYVDVATPAGGVFPSTKGNNDPTSMSNVASKTEQQLQDMTAETLNFSSKAAYSFKENVGEVKYYPCPTALVPTDGTWLKGLAVGLVEPDLVIDSADGLQNFANNVNAGTTYSGKLVVLGANIDLTGQTWEGIGVACSKNFSGTFDGQGYTVNIGEQKYTRAGSECNIGAMFNSVQDATLRNVNVTGSMTVSGAAQNGTSGFCAYAFGTVVIENVHSSVNIKLNGTKIIVGGIVAQPRNNNVTDLTIDGCVYDGNINFANYAQRTGGIIGYTGQNSSASKTITIKNTVFAGNIFLNDPETSFEIGGFIGQVYANGTSNAVSITLSDNISAGNIFHDTTKEWGERSDGKWYYWGAFIGGFGADYEEELSNAAGIKNVAANNLYYVTRPMPGDIDIPSVGRIAGAIQGLGDKITAASVLKKQTQLTELTADDFSPEAKLSFKENAVDLYMPCPTGLVPAEGWLASLAIDYAGARVLGAQIRCTDAADQYSGIRFVTVFEKSAVENAGSADANFGIILISLAKYNALENKTSVEALASQGVKVAATKCDEDSDTYTVKAVVYNIDAENYRDDIVAVAYIGDTVIDTATRSIYSVAELCAADVTASEAARDFSQKVIANAPAAN